MVVMVLLSAMIALPPPKFAIQSLQEADGP